MRSQSLYAFASIHKVNIVFRRVCSSSMIVGITAILLLLAFLIAGSSRADTLPRSILVLEESDALRGPFYSTMFSALRLRVAATRPPISLYIENLDLSFFEGPQYEQALRNFLRQKYRDRQIGAIVTVGYGALQRALAWRSELWSDAPIVFSVVDETAITSLALPRDVTGSTMRVRLRDMVEAARAVVPNLKQVVILGDSFGSQAAAPFKQFQGELSAIAADNLEVVNLTGHPLVELQRRVAALPETSAILYTPIYSDGAGTILLPSDVVAMIAKIANRPIIAPVETFIGRGAVGGFVVLPTVIGEEAAEQVLQVIDGREPSSIPITSGNSVRPVFDWQELQRWRADAHNLPAGSEIRNRPLPIWKQYPIQTAAGVILVLLQSGFITALLYEHRRRRLAEVDASARLNELAHVNRRATAGELSASIAHELNQPLGAVLAHTEACELLIRRPGPDLELIKEILADIRHENQRASEVITRLQRLLKKAQIQMDDFDLNTAVQDVLKFVAAQARASEISLSEVLSPEPLHIRGDSIQIQQVILNLVINAVDAIRDAGAGPSRIVIQTRRVDNAKAEVFVSDTGPGIAPDKLKEIFEPFYSTKPQGMGMGLSIARTIIEAHGGSIGAENREGGGATFRVQLPLIGIERK